MITRMGRDNWNDLVVESAARPLPLPDNQFREWIAGKGIFVSSRMDSELNPSREAVRNYLRSMGATPIMWEEITPRDEDPQRAYLNGVDQSVVYILILGSSYGVTDSSGYSPTHQEGNRAAERKIPRLLFTLAGVNSSERDGRLNDWIRSLYNEISGASFNTPENLVAQLDARLREMAAQSYRLWIKLGNLIFPGQVAIQSSLSNRSSEFTVIARVTQGGVRYNLLNLNQPFNYAKATLDRLTWSNQSFPVQVESVSAEAEFTAEDTVKIKCSTPQHRNSGSASQLVPITISGGYGGKSIGPADLAKLWAQRVCFGAEMNGERNAWSTIQSLTTPNSKTLPEVLAATDATGWLAEGLTRLYIVEEFTQRYNGYFQYLDVGPTTATGIRINGSFVFTPGSTYGNETVDFQGSVSLRY